MVSDVEVREIRKHLPNANTVIISNIHSLDGQITPKTFEQRHGAVFVGNWNHLPNRDAVLWFSKHILPLVHPHVDNSFVFHVVGANPLPDQIRELNNTQIDGVTRVIVHGYIEDLQAFYGDMRVSVAPLRWGAGVKGKVNTAMKHGVPTVCTSITTEGMFTKHNENVLIADEAAAFAENVRVWRLLFYRRGCFARGGFR